MVYILAHVYPSIEATAVQAIFGAIEEYENKTCIRFKPRDPATDSDFVQFYKGYG